MISTPPYPSASITTSPTRHEIREASFGSSPTGIMDFLDDEMEANQNFILQNPYGYLNHLSSTRRSSSSDPTAPFLLLQPRHDCTNSLWNHSNNANDNATRTQRSRQQTSTSQPLSDREIKYSVYSDQECTLEIQVEDIPSGLLLPLAF
ncbi:unnamed protein product [Cylindrotheca closterium]|uniref:Uncharacterized protein n=1 Tax=Cylindrotheca closterium TaxID=2856 RepID=A0AAD2FCU4_9STRA|nr:unnamed protein product [Cylindrotheca closterium]